MEQTTNEETEVTSQPGNVIEENLKQKENVDDSFSSESSLLETSIEKNSVVSGLSTNWYFEISTFEIYLILLIKILMLLG